MPREFDYQAALKIISEAGQPDFRSKQLMNSIFVEQIEDFEDLTTFPKELRERLKLEFGSPNPLQVAEIFESKHGDAFKTLLKTSDGKLIESVLLQVKEPYWTVCVSSQIGCAMGCNFCATGTMGLTRNLTTMEICWQVLLWIKYLRGKGGDNRVTNVVYMGMGEPLTNARAVSESITMLSEGTGMSPKRFSVSTSGIVPMIEKFPQMMPKGVKLAISIHAANDKLRSRIMPVNDRFSLEGLLRAAKKYVDQTQEKIFFEYIMMRGINDSEDHAKELGKLLRPLGRVHLNLIYMNPVEKSEYQPTGLVTVEKFREYMRQEGIETTIRRDHGQDIMGACGQLVTIGGLEDRRTGGSGAT